MQCIDIFNLRGQKFIFDEHLIYWPNALLRTVILTDEPRFKKYQTDGRQQVWYWVDKQSDINVSKGVSCNCGVCGGERLFLCMYELQPQFQ